MLNFMQDIAYIHASQNRTAFKHLESDTRDLKQHDAVIWGGGSHSQNSYSNRVSDQWSMTVVE